VSTAALLDLIRSRRAVVGIVGQGYVGLPLALVFNGAGFSVFGLDLDPRKVDALNRGDSYIKHIGAARVANAVKSGRFRASADFDELKACDAVLICVPTPLGQHREPDLSFVLDST
jgi:UDP-N-acetyl-D-glucosamine dehydrogenase